MARMGVQAKNEIFLHRQLAAGSSGLHGPIEIGLPIARDLPAIIQFGGSAAEVQIAQNGFPSQESFDVKTILVSAVCKAECRLCQNLSAVSAVCQQLGQIA